MASDGLEHLVAGMFMNRSLADFRRACGAHIAEGQQKVAPDTALIAPLCNAARLGRELEGWLSGRRGTA